MTKAADKKKFRAIGHHLKPIVTVAGNGLSESVMSEISRALTDHELIKALLYRAAEKPNPALSNILRSGLL